MVVTINKDMIVYNMQKNQLVLSRDLLPKDVGVAAKA